MEKQTRQLSKFFKVYAIAAMAVLSSCATAAPHNLSAVKFDIEGPKSEVVDGGIFKVTVQPNGSVTDVVGEFQGQVIEFYAEPGKSSYSAWVGVEYGTKSGDTEMKVRVRSGSDFAEEKIKVTIKLGTYPSETLAVAPRTVTPTKRDQKIIAKDRALLGKIYAAKTNNVYWDPPLVMPIESDITSVYGSSRVYNGKKQNVHLGTDLRAKIGTPIRAPIQGKVVVARNLFYTGKTVVIDHGYGLFSVYGHLSRLKIKEGKLIAKGQLMGLSGATGRVTGPHLHWGFQLHGVKVDPMVLVQSLK